MILNFNRHPLNNLNNGRNTTTGNVRNRTTASTFGPSASGGYGSSGATIDLYNPVIDRLDEGSIIEDWIPRDSAGLNQMFSLMYHRDPIAGTVVDLLGDLIWDEFDLVGLDDPEIKKVYLDCLSNMDVLTALPGITKEFLVMGRSITSMVFDKQSGLFTDLISHDQSFVRVTPIPIRGYDPKLDLMVSPALRQFVASQDKRDLDAIGAIPANYVNAIMKGGTEGIPLDPVSTLFLPRRVFNYDYIGTSLYTRLISFWALEKALINATMASARRRSSPILHVRAGIDNVWRPTDDELQEIAGLFLSADQDPVGAVVTTRTGIDASEVKSGTDFYKWSDEWTLLTEGKMRALGANDSLLSGEATYNNQESAQMFLMEKANSLRNTITNRIFYKKLFPLIARVHGFIKVRGSAPHGGIQSGVKLTQRDILSIPESDLIIPTIRHRKDLVQNSDTSKMDIYEKLEEKGVPITLRNWAAAGGINLGDQVAELEADSEIRKRVAEFKNMNAAASFDPATAAQQKFIEAINNMSTAGVKNQLKGIKNQLGGLNAYPFWDEQGQIAGVSAKEMNKFMAGMDPNSNSVRALYDHNALRKMLITQFKAEDKAAVAHYLIFRTGLTPVAPALTDSQSEMLKNNLDSASVAMLNSGNPATKVLEIVNSEIKTIEACHADKKKEVMKSLQSTVANVYKSPDRISSNSKNLFSGN